MKRIPVGQNLNDVVTVLWLKSLKGFGNRTVQKLYEATQMQLNDLWQMKESELKALKVLNEGQIYDLLNQRQPDVYQDLLKKNLDNNLTLITPWSTTHAKVNFPETLKHIYDAPVLLYLKGRKELLTKKGIGVVGTRNPTEQGIKTSGRFARVFSQHDLVVVSGMAEGIDAAAHIGAMHEQGGTLAVLGSGIDVPYPKVNRAIYDKILEEGLIVSEYPMGTQPQKGYFSKRNRIISGLSEALVIVEASQKSGALITANYGLDQGKSIFAVPGSIYSSRCEGCHALIRQGAQLVTTAQQVLEEVTSSTQWSNEKENSTAVENACYHGLYGLLWQQIKEREPIMLEDLLKVVKADRATVFQYTLDLMIDGAIDRGYDGAFRVKEKS